MHRTLAALAIVVLPAAWCVPAASQEPTQQVPARVLCSPDGKVVGIKVLIPEPGLFVLQLPPGVCERVDGQQQPTAPRAPASAGRPHVSI